MYIEGYNFAEDHCTSEFFNLLGCDFISNGNDVDDILRLSGIEGSFVENMYFDYGHSVSSRVRPDVIGANEGDLLFDTQDSLGYAVVYDNGQYKVISSSFLLGALLDGDGKNTKNDLMKQYLNFFEGTLSIRDVTSRTKARSGFELYQNYPNPFVYSTEIKFQLFEKADYVTLTIFNLMGQEVLKLNNFIGNGESYSVFWDGKNINNDYLPSGTYIYKLQIGNKCLSRRMNLIR